MQFWMKNCLSRIGIIIKHRKNSSLTGAGFICSIISYFLRVNYACYFFTRNCKIAVQAVFCSSRKACIPAFSSKYRLFNSDVQRGIQNLSKYIGTDELAHFEIKRRGKLTPVRFNRSLDKNAEIYYYMHIRLYKP